MITDVCVCGGSDATTTPRRLALTAASCGFDSIVLCGPETPPVSYAGVTLYPGKLIGKQNGKTFLDSIRKTPKGTIVLVSVADNSFNRTAITTRGVHLLTGICDLPKGGFDHIVAKMAAQQNVGVVLDLAKILDGKTRRTALARYAEILAFHRKFRFPLLIASGARDQFGFRTVQEVTALCALFGMTREEVSISFGSLEGILNPPRQVTIVETKTEEGL